MSLIHFVIGAYRVNAILTGRRRVDAFLAEQNQERPGRDQRALRAYLNCVENGPVLGAVVLVAALSGGGTARGVARTDLSWSARSSDSDAYLLHLSSGDHAVFYPLCTPARLPLDDGLGAL